MLVVAFDDAKPSGKFGVYFGGPGFVPWKK